MTYEPREGVDYIVDLYQVANVEPDAEAEAIKRALNERLKEYHPDRLQGLAPEFRSKGERLVPLLNRAKVILLDTDKRVEYDGIMAEWDGPVSRDGTPIVRIGDAIRYDAANKTPEELEAAIGEQHAAATAVFKHDPAQQKMLATLFESADGDMKEQLRDALDKALLAEDQVLATTQDTRAQLLGMPENSLLAIGEDHTEKVALAIETARASQTEEYKRRALGGVSTRLALLAGSTPEEQSSSDIVPMQAITDYGLPAYYDEQAKQLAEVAEQRQAIVDKRLELFEPTYPIPELQTEAHPTFVVGVATEKSPEEYKWIGFHFDVDAVALNNIGLPVEISVALDAGQYEAVYQSGINILTFTSKEQIDLRTMLAVAYNKHLEKYFPGILGEEE